MTEEPLYCEPDREREGDPCIHCGVPRAQKGLTDGIYAYLNAEPCAVRMRSRAAQKKAVAHG